MRRPAGSPVTQESKIWGRQGKDCGLTWGDAHTHTLRLGFLSALFVPHARDTPHNFPAILASILIHLASPKIILAHGCRKEVVPSTFHS